MLAFQQTTIKKGLSEEKINKIAKLLKEYRKRANLTQPQLAGASGVATSIVNDVENGIRNAGSKTLDRIARGLNLSDEERFTFIMAGLSLSKRVSRFLISLIIRLKF